MAARASEAISTPTALDRILPILQCPACSGDVTPVGDGFRCGACGASYPLQDGIARFERLGSAEGWEKKQRRTSEEYQQQYNLEGRAESYNRKYEEKFFKRMSTQRELGLLRRLLAAQGGCETLLDLPCGGGRLSPAIAPFTKLLIECDASVGQVLHARARATDATPRVFLTGSGFHVPFKDASLDGIVCVRLSHHLPSDAERERLVRELLRVARRFVIVTFFDYDSMKNRLRRARAVFAHKRPKKTMTVERVRALAHEAGAELTTAPHLAWFGSGHRYALLQKR